MWSWSCDLELLLPNRQSGLCSCCWWLWLWDWSRIDKFCCFCSINIKLQPDVFDIAQILHITISVCNLDEYVIRIRVILPSWESDLAVQLALIPSTGECLLCLPGWVGHVKASWFVHWRFFPVQMSHYQVWNVLYHRFVKGKGQILFANQHCLFLAGPQLRDRTCFWPHRQGVDQRHVPTVSTGIVCTVCTFSYGSIPIQVLTYFFLL